MDRTAVSLFLSLTDYDRIEYDFFQWPKRVSPNSVGSHEYNATATDTSNSIGGLLYFNFMPISSSNTAAAAPFTHRKKMTSNNEELRGRASINRSIGKSETIVLSTDIPHREMIPAASLYCLPSNSNINRRCTCLALVNPSRPSRDGPRILSRLPCMVVKNLSSRFQFTICLQLFNWLRSKRQFTGIRIIPITSCHLYRATVESTLMLPYHTHLFVGQPLAFFSLGGEVKLTASLLGWEIANALHQQQS